MSGATVERELEALAVTELLDRAERGPAGLVVDGEAGIGKSTLVLDAAERASERGFRVLLARGSPAEVSYAYAALSDMLSGVDDATVAALPDVQRTALERARSGAFVGGPVTDERFVANAFLSVIESIGAHAAVLLAIDDAQWLDASSRAVIGFAAWRLAGPVGMLVTIRSGEPASPDQLPWLSFRRPETVARIRMRPLSLGGVHALIARRLGRTLPRPTITRIHEISGGNPFFALELAARAADDASATVIDLPNSLAALVRRRLGHTPDDATNVLLAAACAAAPTVQLVGRVAAMPVARVVDLLQAEESRGVVVLDGDRVRFTHPLFATGVYSNATSARRRAIHRKLAELVDQPELRARHLALAATTADATTLTALDSAADAMVTQGAPAVAAELIELALNLGGDTPQRQIRAGELHFRAGSLARSRVYLQSALQAAPGGVLRSMALMWLGAVKGYDDDLLGAVEALSKAADEATDVPALRLLCLLRLTFALAMADRFGDAIDRSEVAVRLAEQVGVPGLRSQALSILVVVKFVWGLGVDRQALLTAVELEDPLGGASTWFRASAVEALTSAYTGDLVRAAAQMRAVQQRMRADGTEVDRVWAAIRVAKIAVWSGRYADAADAAREAAEHAEQLGGRSALTTAWTSQATVAAYVGRESEARALAMAAIDASHAVGARQLFKEPTRVLGFIEVSLGNYGTAVEVLRPLIDAFDPPHEIEVEGGGHLPDAIEAFIGLGRLADAETLVDALERHGAARDRPWMLAVGARGRGLTFAARGELEDAQRAVEQAMCHHDRLPMPFERARTQLLLGQLQRRRRQKAGAAATLRAALDVFENLGTPLWAARARAELDRLGSPRGDGQLLTAAEQRVADLAAAGQSNKQIANHLFIAEKTVEINLSSTYRKLGIRSRAGLSTALRPSNVQGP